MNHIYKGIEQFQKRIKPNLGGISALGVLVLIFLVMSLERNVLLLQNYTIILTIIIPVGLYCLAVYAISVSWTRFLINKKVLPGDKAVVIVYTSVARHINISMALVLSVFSLDQASMMMLLLIIAYLIQVPSLAFFAQNIGRKLINENSS